jgi:hypothetical protein
MDAEVDVLAVRAHRRVSPFDRGGEDVRAAIVLTSIHDCTHLLNGYLANLEKYGHEANIILIPDRKTTSFRPPSCVICPGTREQVQVLEHLNFPMEEIPWNSDNRRNVGYLMALADGAEMIVSIDDDNYCPEDEDFIGEHESALFWEHQMSVSVEGGWYNNCNLLRPRTTPGIYPRGFPYYARTESKSYFPKQDTAIPKVNAGMWIGDPDLDAITWLSRPYHSKSALGSVCLAPDTWCPINSQNTAVTREMMAAYWFVRMDPPMDRFGDIFQGYFALKVAKHLGWTARFGTPFVRHIRNSHVYMKDIQKEIGPILLIEELLPKLIEHKLTGSTVVEAYLSLADFIAAQDSQVYRDMAPRMRLWAATCQRING